MDYKLVYTQRALDDLAEIVGYIAEDDVESASHFGNSLVSHIEMLARFPKMGALIRKRAHVRKLVHSPFFVYYHVRKAEQQVEVVHIRHAARKPPKSELRPQR